MVFHASPSPLKEHWWRCIDQDDTRCANVFALKDPSRDICDLPSSSWVWTQQSKSIISQFNLICGASWRSQFANSGFFMGYLIGSGVFGSVADSRGRKPVLFGCTALGAIFTMAAGLAPNYVAYFIFRLITGIGAAGQALTAYILATESVGPGWRGTAGVATQLFFIVGEFVLVLVAFIARPWRVLCFACAVVNAAMLFLWPTLPESPRWLLVKGRKDEATAILARIAAGNRRAMPSEPLADPGDRRTTATAASAAIESAAEEGTPLQLEQHAVEKPHHHQQEQQQQRSSSTSLSSAHSVSLTGMLLKDRRMLRRFLVLAYVWMVMCMAYYGISLALGGLPGSIYVTFMITAAAELPSNILAAWMIERYGRHNTMAAGMLLGGAACLGCAFVPAGVVSALMAAVGKFGCAGAFTVASIFTSEMFPTLVRSAVLGAENEAARVGGISAPFIVLVGISTGQAAMPFIIFGVTSLVAGVAIFTLPETLGTTLPDTMSDMVGIQSIFTTQPWRRGGWRQTLREMFRVRGGPPVGAAGSPAKNRSSATSISVHAETPNRVQGLDGRNDSDHAGGGGGSSSGSGYVKNEERHALLHAATSRSDILGPQRATGWERGVQDEPMVAGYRRGATTDSIVVGSTRGTAEGTDRQTGPSRASYFEHKREELRRFP
ncbi:hypothetical protein VOLCADRAFT_95576 [Volvox carteri f. nagariensis]|uniref:Major facilitator superfamily (MFS) profile domain-containing protein n=1 Tax=Volvox carteri f. nagariensis TaxID=3068 RepID=D8U7Z4_VOLCA|nr:uncharacterized protein VOLCADRAFT_95576 [Volvox carteri f. nagariensis]EFJ44180.1 hypothetical protein VOLCADRAFT_95576 [Volvox carteri f. nagariensis]|eukprot:XP_002954774.1 hypothetical protein VOLCADRAFT_95576 [Volvox carteri f. nagariensis]